jgi:hypothetical protein
MGKSRAPEIDEDGLVVRTNPKGLLDFDASQTAYDITSQGAHATGDTLGLPPFLLMASRQTLLAYIAAFLGSRSLRGVEKRKSRGRRASVMDIEEKRAWIIWWYVRQQREIDASHVGSRTVRQLIEEVRGLPGGEMLFPMTMTGIDRLISSVSNGKRKLGIGKDWQSETCEKLLPINNNR